MKSILPLQQSSRIISTVCSIGRNLRRLKKISIPPSYRQEEKKWRLVIPFARDSYGLAGKLDESTIYSRDVNNSSEVPSTVAEWARERYMLLDYLQTNPKGSLAPLLESIQARIPESAITLKWLKCEKAETCTVAIVPAWFHNAMMSLEPVSSSLNMDAIPWLLSEVHH